MSDYTVFISHRHRDELVTKALVKILHRNTDRVHCFISEEIEKGIDWRKEITKVLNVSSFLVLVFTDPDEDWGWCFYETGFFDALSQIPGATQTRRIYCLHHHSTKPPSPLANLQSIPATPARVTEWLQNLFAFTEQTKQEFIGDIPKTADQICGLFRDNRKPIYLEKWVDVTLTCSSLKSPDDLPDDTIIQGDQGLMQEVFGTNTGRIDWKSAKKIFSKFPNSSEVNFRALKEISRGVHCICNDRRPRPIQGTIFVGDGPKRYRPVVSDAKEVSEGSINCRILFVEEVGGPLQNVDKTLGALLTAMRMAVRIRWEIVRPFCSNVRFLSRDPEKLRFDLQTCLNNIFSEAEFRGTFSLLDLRTSFGDEEDKAKIQKIIDESDAMFGKLWLGIGFSNPLETFGEVLTERFSEENITLLEDGLADLEKMNSEFLEMSTVRAEALIRRELGKTHGDIPRLAAE